MIALLVALALAETPFPSYRDATTLKAWAEIDALIEAGDLDEAIDQATRFERTVTETAGLEYLIGLAWRLKDNPKAAEKHMLRAVELDPAYHSPWYDLGEMWLSQGRFAEAEKAFAEVTRLVTEGPNARLGPRRQAEVAAHQGDAAAFEEHIREALRRGFSFRDIAGLPAWKRFYADPVMRGSVEKMITVYGDRAILDTLAPPG